MVLFLTKVKLAKAMKSGWMVRINFLSRLKLSNGLVDLVLVEVGGA